MLTRQEIARKASEASQRAARTRRFARYAAEMRKHPEDLGETSKNDLAEALADAGGWEVHVNPAWEPTA